MDYQAILETFEAREDLKKVYLCTKRDEQGDVIETFFYFSKDMADSHGEDVTVETKTRDQIKASAGVETETEEEEFPEASKSKRKNKV